MFGLFVRFTCKDQASAEAYDRLVAETVAAIKANEPGTLVYASQLVKGRPLQRICYELYRDKVAFECTATLGRVLTTLPGRPEAGSPNADTHQTLAPSCWPDRRLLFRSVSPPIAL